MVLQPSYRSVLSAFGQEEYWWLPLPNNTVAWLTTIGPILPTALPKNFVKSGQITGSEFSSIIATMPAYVQSFFSSVAADQASIESSVSAAYATSSMSSSLVQDDVTTTRSATASPTGKKNSATNQEVLSAGALAIWFIGVLILL